MTSRMRRLGPLGVAVTLAAGLAACGSGSSGRPVAATTPATTATHSPAATPRLDPAALVARVALTDADFSDGSRIQLIPGGDQVRGQVTMDNCGYAFTTEAHRVARRQVAMVPGASDQIDVSNEVVAYDSAAQAAKAMQEFRRSVTGCRKGVYQTSRIAAEPPMRYDVSRLSRPGGLPVADTAQASLALTAKGQPGHIYAFVVFERRGAVIDGVYVDSSSPISASYVTFGLTLARITGTRLAAAPA